MWFKNKLQEDLVARIIKSLKETPLKWRPSVIAGNTDIVLDEQENQAANCSKLILEASGRLDRVVKKTENSWQSYLLLRDKRLAKAYADFQLEMSLRVLDKREV